MEMVSSNQPFFHGKGSWMIPWSDHTLVNKHFFKWDVSGSKSLSLPKAPSRNLRSGPSSPSIPQTTSWRGKVINTARLKGTLYVKKKRWLPFLRKHGSILNITHSIKEMTPFWRKPIFHFLEIEGGSTVSSFKLAQPQPKWCSWCFFFTREFSVMESLTLGIQSPCQMMIGVYNRLLSRVFRLHVHSQKVIGSLGIHYYQIMEFIINRWSHKGIHHLGLIYIYIYNHAPERAGHMFFFREF